MKNALATPCPSCGLTANLTHEPAYQEYPGASLQGGYEFLECPNCGLEEITKADLSDFQYAENTRGW